MGKLYHLDVGCGDASVISTGTSTLLVDCHNIGDYSYLLPKNKSLRAVFVTHQHTDHFSGLKYLRDKGYSIDYLIYSPYARRYGDASVTIAEWNDFNSHRDFFEKKGTRLYDPYRQDSFDKPWWSPDGLKFWMLGPVRSIAAGDTRELHDACLVMRSDLGSRKCLFTGDASDTSLENIGSNTTHMCDDILHASHHGSLNGAESSFVKKCSAVYTVVSTKSGVYENVPHPTAMKRYKDNTSNTVYRTDTDSTVTWTF